MLKEWERMKIWDCLLQPWNTFFFSLWWCLLQNSSDSKVKRKMSVFVPLLYLLLIGWINVKCHGSSSAVTESNLLPWQGFRSLSWRGLCCLCQRRVATAHWPEWPCWRHPPKPAGGPSLSIHKPMPGKRDSVQPSRCHCLLAFQQSSTFILQCGTSDSVPAPAQDTLWVVCSTGSRNSWVWTTPSPVPCLGLVWCLTCLMSQVALPPVLKNNCFDLFDWFRQTRLTHIKW